MVELSRRGALASLGVAVLAGCGGGSASTPSPSPSPTPTPAPAPSPTPSPTPTPLPPVGNFGTLGVTTSQTFAGLGYARRATLSGWDFNGDFSSTVLQPLAMRFSAPSTLLLTLPGLGEDVLVARPDEGSASGGQRTSASFNVHRGHLSVSRPMVGTAMLQYALRAEFSAELYGGQTNPWLLASLMYGLATPPNAPQPGSRADYQTQLPDTTARIDFVTRTVTGAARAFVDSASRIFAFRDGLLSADGTRFEARLVSDTTPIEGRIEALLMGPAHDELIVRLTTDTYVMLLPGRRAA